LDNDEYSGIPANIGRMGMTGIVQGFSALANRDSRDYFDWPRLEGFA